MSAYRARPSKKEFDHIFSPKAIRKLDNRHVFYYGGNYFHVKTPVEQSLAKRHVELVFPEKRDMKVVFMQTKEKGGGEKIAEH